MRRKKLILDIIQCEVCRLIFRWPMDTEAESNAYYQHIYSDKHPQVRLPSPAELKVMMARNFADTPLDLGSKIALLKAIRPNARILDYGCSWGYGTAQLAKDGFDATGFEISHPRAQYGRDELGLKIIDDFQRLRSLERNSFDVIFSHHVLEHLPNPKSAFQVMSHLLSEGGILLHILPNFSGRLARTGTWLKWIGEEHPLAPTIEFLRGALANHGFNEIKFASSPFDKHLAESLRSPVRSATQTEGDELLVLASR